MMTHLGPATREFDGGEFAVLYVRLGRLWPVVLAHGVLDFVAFIGFEC
jgi:hypothetical protein